MNDQSTSKIDQLMAHVREEVGGTEAASAAVPEQAVPGALSLSEIMRRVRAEVARRRGAGANASDDTIDDGPFPRWRPVAGRLAAKQAYALGELLTFSDVDFVRTVYQIVLRRSPDSEGEQHYLRQMRNGHASKVEVIGDLRFSAEGRARGVHVDGLLIPYTFARWKRKRVIGPVLRWVHAFVRLGALTDRQAAQIAVQAQETQAVGASLNRVSDALVQWQEAVYQQIESHPSAAAFEVLRSDFDTCRNDLRNALNVAQAESARHVQEAVAQALDTLNLLRVRMEEAEQAQRDVSARTNDLADRVITTDAKLVAHEKASLVVDQRVAHVERVVSERGQVVSPNSFVSELRSLSDRLLDTKVSMEARFAKLQGVEAGDAVPALGNLDLDPLYAAFEDRFRGDRVLVRRRAEPYLDIVREVGAGTIDAPVLDIGCGRGEWLELLRDHGLTARGIDLNRVFADICRGYGLDVMEGDAIKILTSLQDNSIGAITSMHLVEHLSFEQVIVLLDEARRVLRPGGVIVLETPNPENPSVGSHTFYMDPTHRNPLPPEALRWIVEARGFQSARVERLMVARELNAPGLVPEDMPGASSINAMLAALNIAPDYAIVATKA
ncbi:MULTISPECIES: methyltransferase domain-containing protein [unclassified Dyella]|uniref:methyltransferase domain-containing protein n=1 Tax=unclassified Dyella TaxID=2634549 RepID=UPI000C84FA3A|nr:MULTISPECIES: methyltransferase domain-containing protein [unclassified Dyella]MDR3444400.1 methyltransferase domain-containing protein [Dyella sp.]PMQ06017.1 putative S-adenosylmethionine-dependent methyltransferase/MSMEI2290 [Dyella sp. AD56]